MSQEEHVLEGIQSSNDSIANNAISLCISHSNLPWSRDVSLKRELL